VSSTVEIVPPGVIEEVAYANGYRPAPLRNWAGCRCSTSHKSTSTWIKCRLNFYHDNGENKHKPSFETRGCSGREPWLVLMKTYSGSYYTHHSGKSNNCGYYTYEVESFSSHRGALNRFHQLHTKPCINHFEGPNKCYSKPCRFVEQYIVYISKY
jgi:hypothetical protein